jgi:hypothetical protein
MKSLPLIFAFLCLALPQPACAFEPTPKQVQPVAAFSHTVMLNSEDSWGSHDRGVTLAQLGQYDKSLEDLEKSFHLNPKASCLIATQEL